MTDLIAVTGATGELGRRVARLLADRNVAQRLVVREAKRAPDIPGVEIAVADYGTPDALKKAFSGAKTLFFVSAHEAPGRQATHRAVVEAAKAAGVERVVYTSFMGASPNATFTYARDHAHTEMAIRDSGMKLTALRNALYADVAPHLVGDHGIIRGPAGNGAVAWVAREDVARLAAAVLVDPSHINQIYDVSGSEPIDLHATAQILSEVSGREITYVPETLEEARASRAGNEPWLIEGWVSSYAAIATGECSVTSHTIEHVTGKRPWSFAEFLNAEPDSWKHLVRH
ncbi:MAG: SDR family oxidoreductase [Polyangiaceae bacterium]